MMKQRWGLDRNVLRPTPGDHFTILKSDFLKLRRTDLDLEADPEELGALLTFDLEDLELAPFDGSAACDLDSVSDLKISAASSVPFFLFSPRSCLFCLRFAGLFLSAFWQWSWCFIYWVFPILLVTMRHWLETGSTRTLFLWLMNFWSCH